MDWLLLTAVICLGGGGGGMSLMLTSELAMLRRTEKRRDGHESWGVLSKLGNVKILRSVIVHNISRLCNAFSCNHLLFITYYSEENMQ